MNKDEFIKECFKINIVITEGIYNKFLLYGKNLNEWIKNLI